MTSDYKLRLYNRAGTTLLTEVTDFIELHTIKEVNTMGVAQFTLDADKDYTDQFRTTNRILEIHRRDKSLGIDWYLEWWGIVKNEFYQYNKTAGGNLITLTAQTQHELLNRRIVAWKAETANRSLFSAVPAETIMKTLVTYNCTASASTANGRERAGSIAGLSVATDSAGGNIISLGCAWANLLQVLQGVARIGGGDFGITRDYTTPAIGIFRFYPGQLGSDKSASVIFSLENANMEDPSYLIERSEEKTVAIVGGKGEAGDRAIVVRTGANYDASVQNVEAFVDYRNSDVTAELNSAGDKFLAENEKKEILDFNVIQEGDYVYKVDYGHGDLVTGRYLNIEQTVKVQRVQIDLPESGDEQITIGLQVIG